MVIGITGGIASGKSIVSKYLKKSGYRVIDSDSLAHNILKTANVQRVIYQTFGVKERAELSKIVFNDAEQMKKLNAIMKPLILSELIDEMAYINDEIYFVDAPVLYEMEISGIFDIVMVVYVNRKTQIERLMKRDTITEEYAKRKINMQMSLNKKKALGDFIIDNNHSEEVTYKQIDEILRRLQNEI